MSKDFKSAKKRQREDDSERQARKKRRLEREAEVNEAVKGNEKYLKRSVIAKIPEVEKILKDIGYKQGNILAHLHDSRIYMASLHPNAPFQSASYCQVEKTRDPRIKSLDWTDNTFKSAIIAIFMQIEYLVKNRFTYCDMFKFDTEPIVKMTKNDKGKPNGFGYRTNNFEGDSINDTIRRQDFMTKILTSKDEQGDAYNVATMIKVAEENDAADFFNYVRQVMVEVYANYEVAKYPNRKYWNPLKYSVWVDGESQDKFFLHGIHHYPLEERMATFLYKMMSNITPLKFTFQLDTQGIDIQPWINTDTYDIESMNEMKHDMVDDLDDLYKSSDSSEEY